MPPTVTANMSPEDAGLFFELMWAVQSYVNRQLGLLPTVKTAQQYAAIGMEEKFQVRQALWERPQLLDAFVAENPGGLPPASLQVIASWKHFVAGRFFITRFLKRHAIFVADPLSSGVYAVAGLYDSIEDVIDASYLPVAVEAVLLPFKGRIIYDGLLAPYSVLFGPGITSELNETYQSAKQKGAIIESLEPSQTTSPKSQQVVKSKHNWRPALGRSIEAIEHMPPADTVVQRRAISLLKTSAQLAKAAADNPDDLHELNQLAQRVQKALVQLEVAFSRAE